MKHRRPGLIAFAPSLRRESIHCGRTINVTQLEEVLPELSLGSFADRPTKDVAAGENVQGEEKSFFLNPFMTGVSLFPLAASPTIRGCL